MAHSQAVADRIIKEVSHSPGCLLDELVSACPDLTWNQVFSEVDHLSRTGELSLKRQSHGRYTLSLPSR